MNGLLVLDKSAGMTSHDVVAIVRRATGERSIGHLGTLDPMATGVLPCCWESTHGWPSFTAAPISRIPARSGLATRPTRSTPMERRTRKPKPLTQSLDELRELATRFHGTLDQVPPVFSAKKINGVPAHKLARTGQPVR